MATIRLAIVVSTIGVVVAVTAERFGGLPAGSVVYGVIALGFAASWVRSGRRSTHRPVWVPTDDPRLTRSAG